MAGSIWRPLAVHQVSLSRGPLTSLGSSLSEWEAPERENPIATEIGQRSSDVLPTALVGKTGINETSHVWW